MSRSLNKVELIGHVGRDPEIRTWSGGKRIARVPLATNRTVRRSGQEEEVTEWHRLTFFGKLAEIAEKWVGKGDRLYVEGRLHYSQVEGDDGHTRHYTEIVVESLIMLGSQAADAPDAAGQGQQSGRGREARRGRQQSAPRRR